MIWLFALEIIIILATLVAIFRLRRRPVDPADTWPYYPRRPLSTTEKMLYTRLKQALPDHIILAQVRLSRLLAVREGSDCKAWLNRISRLSADFVVCNRDASILAVIELEHARRSAKHAESVARYKDKALFDAGITLHRWHPRTIPDEDLIKTTLLSKPMRPLSSMN